MRHEYSHEQDGGEISQAPPNPAPSEPSDGVDRPIADATITIQDGTGATTIVNPGCVSSTTMALWLLGVLAVFEIVENMMADDLFLAFVSTLKTLLL
ncbi:MAG: hypothetical protein GYB66_07580, partial [Chloroflexi bacterium]|nr:hypothetical protein [Chloroflexota bacterium]